MCTSPKELFREIFLETLFCLRIHSPCASLVNLPILRITKHIEAYIYFLKCLFLEKFTHEFTLLNSL